MYIAVHYRLRRLPWAAISRCPPTRVQRSASLADGVVRPDAIGLVCMNWCRSFPRQRRSCGSPSDEARLPACVKSLHHCVSNEKRIRYTRELQAKPQVHFGLARSTTQGSTNVIERNRFGSLLEQILKQNIYRM